MHSDMSISKSSASYLAKLQWDEVKSILWNSSKYVDGLGRGVVEDAFLSLDSHCLVALWTTHFRCKL